FVRDFLLSGSGYTKTLAGSRSLKKTYRVSLGAGKKSRRSCGSWVFCIVQPTLKDSGAAAWTGRFTPAREEPVGKSQIIIFLPRGPRSVNFLCLALSCPAPRTYCHDHGMISLQVRIHDGNTKTADDESAYFR